MSFPSPASDYSEKSLDLNELCIAHPAATFMMTVEGNALRGAGIFNGDLVLVDRSIKARHGHFVVAVVHGDLVIRRLQVQPRLALVPHHPNYKAIFFDHANAYELEIWGVIRTTIRNMLCS